jgi:methionyl aminopeptidase
LGYRKYPCQTCISVNDEVVHGLASDRELRFGDIVSVDVGVKLQGFYRRQRPDGGGGRLRQFWRSG